MPRSQSNELRLAIALVGTLLLLTRFPASAEDSCPPQAVLEGAWVEQGGDVQLLFERERVILWEKGLLRAASVLRREPCRLVVRDGGVLAA